MASSIRRHPFATITTDASCGAVNSMHDSFTPIGGLVPMFNIHMGEVVFGGVGAGLYGMLVFVVIAIFIAGLMVGRTPEYLGKKIEAYDVKVASLSILILTVIILGFTAWAVISPWGNGGTGEQRAARFSVKYTTPIRPAPETTAASSPGLSGNQVRWDTATGFDMLLGRFFMIVPIMALAGSLAIKKKFHASARKLPGCRANVCLRASRNGGDRRRPDLRSGVKHRPDRRALFDALQRSLV